MNARMTLLFPAILLIVSFAAISGPAIEVRMVAHPDEVPRGVSPVPFILETRNVSGHDLKLGRTYVDLLVRDGRYEERPGCEDRLSGELAHWQVPLPPGGVLRRGESVIQAGAFSCRRYGSTPRPLPSAVTLTLKLTASLPDVAGSFRGRRWHGSVTSEPVHITFVEPTGIDKEAYEAMNATPPGKGVNLLGDYPTSTYAAYFLRASECNNRYSLPIVEIMRSRNGAYTRTEAMIDPVTGAQELFRGDDVGNLCNKWLAAAIEAHPNLWFADQLRLGLAINAVWLGEDDAAAAQFAELALKSDLDVIREAATKNLASMVAYHLTKPEALPEKLRSKLPKVELPRKKPAAKK